jgi:hypothetical protein
MERCPNCRARFDGGLTCRRCGMDLALLRRVERAAEAELSRAVAALGAGDAPAAGAAAARSLALRRSPLAARLVHFVVHRLGTAPSLDR